MDKIFWIDTETTGLEVIPGAILETAAVITDEFGNYITGETYQHSFSESNYHLLDPWALETHTKSGLLEECKASTLGTSHIDNLLTAFYEDNFGGKKIPMAGNSIHFDRKWIETHMPRFAKRFSYRNIDISSIKEIAKVVRPDLSDIFLKRLGSIPAHRALPDIFHSIKEYQLYLEFFFTPQSAHSDMTQSIKEAVNRGYHGESEPK